MHYNNNDYVHYIGMVMTAGTILPKSASQTVIKLGEGSTDAYVKSFKKQLEAEVIIAGGPTVTSCVHTVSDIHNEKIEILHNPMITFWKRAVLYYEIRERLVAEGYILRFEDYALIISDPGQSLYMLFGRHWNDEAKAKYASIEGSPKEKTPDLLALLERYYPPLGWNLPLDNEMLWNLLHDFIKNYYQDIVKHFEYKNFEKALTFDFDILSKFMETTRVTWLWF
ncbi:unnamed protein product, partial [marine sediment metagenome]